MGTRDYFDSSGRLVGSSYSYDTHGNERWECGPPAQKRQGVLGRIGTVLLLFVPFVMLAAITTLVGAFFEIIFGTGVRETFETLPFLVGGIGSIVIFAWGGWLRRP